MQTQFQLATLRKESDSITEYFHKTISLATTLGAACQPLSSSEFIIYLLAGLGNDYESLVTSMTTRPDPLSTLQVFSYLLNHESRLAHQTNILLSGSRLAAHTTTRQALPSPLKGKGRGTFYCVRRGRGGRKGGSSQLASRSVWQVCKKPSHTTITCYHIFN